MCQKLISQDEDNVDGKSDSLASQPSSQSSVTSLNVAGQSEEPMSFGERAWGDRSVSCIFSMMVACRSMSSIDLFTAEIFFLCDRRYASAMKPLLHVIFVVVSS